MELLDKMSRRKNNYVYNTLIGESSKETVNKGCKLWNTIKEMKRNNKGYVCE